MPGMTSTNYLIQTTAWSLGGLEASSSKVNGKTVLASYTTLNHPSKSEKVPTTVGQTKQNKYWHTRLSHRQLILRNNQQTTESTRDWQRTLPTRLSPMEGQQKKQYLGWCKDSTGKGL